MHLIYLDESGNTGSNLADPQQPIFVLGALLVPEQQWKSVETQILQLADLCAFHARKYEEIKAGLADKHFDKGGIERLQPLIHSGSESMPDVLAWLTAQNKRSGEDPHGIGSP